MAETPCELIHVGRIKDGQELADKRSETGFEILLAAAIRRLGLFLI